MTTVPDYIRRAFPEDEDEDDDGPDSLFDEAMRELGPKRVQQGRCVHLGCAKRATGRGVTCGDKICISFVGMLPGDLAVMLMEEKAAAMVGVVGVGVWWQSSLLAAGLGMLVMSVGMAVLRLVKLG